MKRTVIIINGSGTCGKDTFVKLFDAYVDQPVINISTIEPIKTIAKQLGWDGTKDEKGRKFLSDLKDLLTRNFDTSFNYIKKVIENRTAEYEAAAVKEIFFFVHCREPQEIEKLTNYFNAISIYIDASKRINQITSNHADAEVLDYHYDYYIDNNSDKENLYQGAITFYNSIESENK